MKFGRSAVFGAFMLFASMIGITPASAHFWQCVPYARMISGIDIHGNANTWWSQAAGRYDRGQEPEVGSVMVLKPHGKMTIGHVAMVSGIVSDREITVTHANWSRPGGVEKDVRVVDVSPDGDWSEVRVWYAGVDDLGASTYPTFGFIYPESPSVQFADASTGGSHTAAVN